MPWFGRRSLQELLDTARRSLKSPLILADLTYHVLAITPDNTIDDPRWIQINQEQSLPLNIVNLGLEPVRPAFRQSGTALRILPGLPIVRCAVAQEDKPIGYLLSPGYGGPPSQEELDLVAILSDLCSLRMSEGPPLCRVPGGYAGIFHLRPAQRYHLGGSR